MSRRILVTGGAGFIGSNVTQRWLRKYPEDRLVNLAAESHVDRSIPAPWFFDHAGWAESFDPREGDVQYAADHLIEQFSTMLGAR